MREHSQCTWVEGGGVLPSGHFKRNLLVPFNEVDTIRERFGNKDCYVTAYRYDSTELRSALKYGALYFDFDCEDNWNAVKEDVLYAINFLVANYFIRREDVEIFFSETRGFTCWFNHSFLDRTHEHLNHIFKFFVREIEFPNGTLDTKILRCCSPVSSNELYQRQVGLYKVPLMYNELKEFDYDQIKELAAVPRLYIENTSPGNDMAKKAYRDCVKRWEESSHGSLEAEREGQPSPWSTLPMR